MISGDTDIRVVLELGSKKLVWEGNTTNCGAAKIRELSEEALNTFWIATAGAEVGVFLAVITNCSPHKVRITSTCVSEKTQSEVVTMSKEGAAAFTARMIELCSSWMSVRNPGGPAIYELSEQQALKATKEQA